jgi:hypothetical protein
LRRLDSSRAAQNQTQSRFVLVFFISSALPIMTTARCIIQNHIFSPAALLHRTHFIWADKRWNAAASIHRLVQCCRPVGKFFSFSKARSRLKRRERDCVSRSTNEAISLSRNQNADCVFEFVATIMINRLCVPCARWERKILLIEKNFRGE